MMASGCSLRIAHHVGHRRLLPALVDAGVARLAFRRPHVMPVRSRSGLRGHGRLHERKCPMDGDATHRALPRHRDGDRQIADIENQLPDLPLRHAPGRHAGVPDAVAYMVEDLAVRHGRDERAKGRWAARIFIRADCGPAVPIDPVTGRAFCHEVLSPLLKSRCRHSHRDWFVSFSSDGIEKLRSERATPSSTRRGVRGGA